MTGSKSSTSAMARALFDGIKLEKKLKKQEYTYVRIPTKDLGAFFTTKRVVANFKGSGS